MTEKESIPQLWYESLDPLDPCVDEEDYPTDEEIEEILQDIAKEQYEKGTQA